jgi:hypothetical protein
MKFTMLNPTSVPLVVLEKLQFVFKHKLHHVSVGDSDILCLICTRKESKKEKNKKGKKSKISNYFQLD